MRKFGIFALAALLCCSLSGCMPFGGRVIREAAKDAAEELEESIMNYIDANSYTAGNFTYAAADVRAVTVSWVGGSVTLAEGAGETLRAEESGTLTAAQQMHWRVKDGVLEIMYCASGYLGIFPPNAKKLTLEVPAGADITVDCVSASIDGSALHAGKLSLATVSGAVTLAGAAAKEIKLHTTSGAVRLTGEITAEEATFETVSGAVYVEGLHCTEADVSSVSGDVTLDLAACGKADIATVSGNVKLTVPKESGATFRYGTVSGKLRCEDYRVHGSENIIGDGACKVSVETVSGGLTVLGA